MQKLKFSCKRELRTIRGYEYKKQVNNGVPVIISHGFLANQRHVKKYATGLAEAGYVVFTFDFCGGGLMSKSDGKFSETSIATEKEDLKAVTEYVENLNYINSEKLILIGESQGGLVSCLVAAEYGERVEKLILLYPALCIPDDAKKGKMLFMRFEPSDVDGTLKCKLFRFSPDYPKSALNLNVGEELARITADTLIIHGERDKIVNVGYAERAKTLVDNCKLEILQGAGHGFNAKQSRKAIALIKDYIAN
ncbi:MAG: lysophospholipase [Clostridia bacterium]|nr:lysophospholipase [Clostridia bacterium]